MMRSITHTYQANGKQLSTIISGWNLLPDNGAIHLLVEKILTLLYKDDAIESIEGVIETELTVNLGLFKTEFNAQILAQEIVSWWYK